MLERLLFWDHKPGSRSVRLWTVLILLAPLALACSIWFQRSVLAEVPVRVEIDRADAIRIATRFLESQGIETEGLTAAVRPVKDWDLYRAFLTSKPDALATVGYWGFLKVDLAESGGPQSMRVDLDLKGNLLGYRLQPPEMPARSFTSEEAWRMAEAARESRQRQWPFLEFGNPEVTEPPPQSTAVTYRYMWPLTFGGIPHLTGKLHIRVQNGKVVENWIEPHLAPAGHIAVSPLPVWVGGVPFGIYLAVLIVFVIIRYLKRKIQKEVSSERLWLVAALIGLFFTIVQYLSDSLVLRGDVEAAPAGVIAATLVSLGIIMGMFGGMFYSACEGDLRESFPNLLTSLDAVLCGKLFSRNVGRGIVLGAVAVSWAFLLRNAVYLIFRPQFAGLNSLESSFGFLFSQVPAVTALLSTPGAALFTCLTALLGPLTLLTRHCRNRKRLFVLLGLAAWFSVAMTAGEPLAPGPLVLASLAVAASILFTFFTVDFLCSIVVLVGWQLLGLAGLSQIAPIWSRHDHWAILAGAAVLAVAVFSIAKAPIVEDSEVRPAYARHIQERIQLQSEVTAAREAQLRLLPSSAPELPSMSIAASCKPAEQVSGDFYDFYRLAPHRVAVLLSDGGGKGLATALAIALTKGYLMHKSESALAPVDALAGVAAMLGEELSGFSAEGLCYAIVDQRERLVRYARIGHTPSPLAIGYPSPVGEISHHRANQIILEGTLRFAPGQPVLFYTNGLSKLLGGLDSQSTNRWILKRDADWTNTSRALIDQLFSFAFFRRSPRHFKDDVTLVVIAADQEESDSVERVA